jgi:hypothetical protein
VSQKITLHPVQARDLHELRRNVQERNSEQSQFYLKRLLMAVNYFYAVAIITEELQRFLPKFEEAYPDEVWVRRLLLAVVSFGNKPEEGVPEMALRQDFPAPGAMNFLKAVYDLTQAMNDKHGNESRVGFMTSALVNVLMADVVQAWYGKRTKAWERVRANKLDPATGQYSDPVATEIAYQFWTDEATISNERELWLALADRIENALKRG